MKKLIILVCILLAFNVSAIEVNQNAESRLKSKLRNLVSSVLGENMSVKFFGPRPEIQSSIVLPEIPQNFKKSTDVSSLTKLNKTATEYDQLPKEKRRLFDYKFIQELFQVTRKTEAKEEDLSNWMNVLDQGGSREGIYQALVLDEVYAALENMEEKPSKSLLDFSMSFSAKFLAQNYTEEKLNHLNLYSLKRIMTERGLDLIEYWENKDLESMYRWYAIFSADLAKGHGSWMKSEIRQDQNVDYHYEWAKNMPSQQIKSEFIIKLHIVMNGVQLLK